ncbi:MAG: valine--tRNA ligase [Patescibacteria group bacterium]|nr:valine--tRNA ligase [Patescibacteria group bacterium]
MKELEKAYEPRKYEDKIYKLWEESGFFNPDVCVEKGEIKKDSRYFSIVLPPPNVTGTLHMGHAVMLAIQDAMVRYHRMNGEKTLWVPGTDHAAIATQTKVEKILIEKGIKDPKNDLGREKFLSEVKKFAQESRDTIVNQCRKMGASLDWSREAYTLDEKRNLAVRSVFKKMYDEGLIERGYRIVNWCPRCHSTLADDEVEYKEQSAKIYTFRYSVEFPFSIATTRPETKLGDTAVAVNPKDKRYKKFIGKIFEIKNFGGGPDLKIKIISDPSVDVSFGTGAVGVTPAHSFADYEMALKNKLSIIKVIDEDGKMTAEAGSAYAGLSAKEARKKIVEFLRTNNLLEKEDDAPNNLSVCYRCETPIEPLPSRQWFIRVEKEFKMGPSKIKGIKKGQKTTLKKLMQAAVRGGQINIIPERFDKTYFYWIDNLRDWCISRQIWYGHRIPVYYCKQGDYHENTASLKNNKCDKSIVSVEEIKKCPHCGGAVEQDTDTLDTWFSSGLWTFSTLGYPDLNSEDLKNFHPTSVMETGYDILFFWVARMILMTTYVLGDIPFEKVYLHGLVRDEQGRKMSKSLGNVINPLDMIEKYGTDAVRLSLLLGNTPGNDMKLSEEKIAGFRNFTNKLWNICRFILSLDNEESAINKKIKPKTVADVWILRKMLNLIYNVDFDIINYNFSQAGEKLREFTWNDLADWYLEASKFENTEEKNNILYFILKDLLKLWHPFMPFVTETIWQEISEEKMLLVSEWPKEKSYKEIIDNTKLPYNFELIQKIIIAIRNMRAENKIEAATKIRAVIYAPNNVFDLVVSQKHIIENLRTGVEECVIQNNKPKIDNAICVSVDGVEIYLSVSIDAEKEKFRLQKEISSAEPYAVGLAKKLSNKEFIKNAPKEIVEKEKQKLSEAEEKIKKLKEQLKNLS